MNALRIITCAVLAPLAACAGTDDAPTRDFVVMPLVAAPLVAGQSGRVFLMPQSGGTRVLVEVSGVPSQWVSLPVHLYTFVHRGNCGALDPLPAYSLLDRVLAGSPSGGGLTPARGPFTVSNVVPLPMPELRAGGFAIVVKSAPSDGDRELFCGNVTS